MKALLGCSPRTIEMMYGIAILGKAKSQIGRILRAKILRRVDGHTSNMLNARFSLEPLFHEDISDSLHNRAKVICSVLVQEMVMLI